ncbi:MAG: hypothetical protein A2Y33_11780 [Spirochaetes bacterium GWF1_51_8]|nr:MAG: hypothetical protein A2Y33_11780 [Spirochaetes bacterium GWF1_51_8]
MIVLRRMLVLGAAILLSAGMLYAGGHTRTAKNAGKDMKQKVFAAIESITELMVSGKKSLGELKTKEEAKALFTEIAGKCKSGIASLAEVFSKFPELATDAEFIEEIKTAADKMERTYKSFMSSIHEWSDLHGLSEEEENEMVSVIKTALGY